MFHSNVETRPAHKSESHKSESRRRESADGSVQPTIVGHRNPESRRRKSADASRQPTIATSSQIGIPGRESAGVLHSNLETQAAHRSESRRTASCPESRPALSLLSCALNLSQVCPGPTGCTITSAFGRIIVGSCSVPRIGQSVYRTSSVRFARATTIVCSSRRSIPIASAAGQPQAGTYGF